MHHGWNDDDYLILFTSEERAPMTAAYAIQQYLPDYTLIGLRSWDEFIVASPDGTLLTVPTVPLDLHHAVAFALPERLTLEPDLGFEGKIKWYVKPLVFGGDATDTANTVWIAHEQHAGLVRWWNEQYLALKGSKPSD